MPAVEIESVAVLAFLSWECLNMRRVQVVAHLREARRRTRGRVLVERATGASAKPCKNRRSRVPPARVSLSLIRTIGYRFSADHARARATTSSADETFISTARTIDSYTGRNTDRTRGFRGSITVKRYIGINISPRGGRKCVYARVCVCVCVRGKST